MAGTARDQRGNPEAHQPSEADRVGRPPASIRAGPGGCRPPTGRRPAGFAATCRTPGEQRTDDRGQLLVGGYALVRFENPQWTPQPREGMLPCFFGGRLSRLVRNARSARISWTRVADGLMTSVHVALLGRDVRVRERVLVLGRSAARARPSGRRSREALAGRGCSPRPGRP